MTAFLIVLFVLAFLGTSPKAIGKWLAVIHSSYRAALNEQVSG